MSRSFQHLSLMMMALAMSLSACRASTIRFQDTRQDSPPPTQKSLPTPSVATLTEEDSLEVLATATAEIVDPSPTIDDTNATSVVPLRTFVGHSDDVTDVAFSPDGSLIASTSLDRSVRLWRTSDGTLERILEGHEDNVLALAFSPDGSLLASASDDRTVRIWQVSDGTLLRVIGNDLLGRVLEVEFSPDGLLLAMAGHRCYVELRYARSGILRRTLAQPGCVASQGGSVSSWGMAFSSDGSQIVTGEARPCCGGSLQLWHVEAFSAPTLLRGYDLAVHDLAYAPDGTKLALAMAGSPTIWMMDPEDVYSPQYLEGHMYRVNDLDFSPTGTILASGSRDATLRLWRVGDGELLTVLEGHTDGVKALTFSNDGSMIASGSEDDTIVLWGLP